MAELLLRHPGTVIILILASFVLLIVIDTIAVHH